MLQSDRGNKPLRDEAVWTARRMAAVALFGLVVAQLLISLGVVWRWADRGWYPLTGDEPHYLVITQAIARYGTFELTQSYRDEFKDRRIYPVGMAPPDATPDSTNTHATAGTHGLFSAHNVGLPLLLVLPYEATGVQGVKAALAALGVVATVCCWIISGIRLRGIRSRVLATATSVFAMPLLLFASQIYPDIFAGLLALVGVTALWSRSAKAGLRPLARVSAALAVAFLPWLQIKFTAVALILVVALVFADSSAPRSRRVVVPCTFALSLVLLAIYNQYAFARVVGPYGADSLQVSMQAVMVFAGLLLDRRHGMFFQNPALIIGLLFLPRLMRRDALVGTTVALGALALVVPNAMHPNWYGGASFSGRFGWSAAMVLLAPTVYGLGEIASAAPRLFPVLCGGLLGLQALFVAQAVRVRFEAYNAFPAFVAAYRSLYGRLVDGFLPALYERRWVLHWVPNVVVGVALVALLVVAWRDARAPVGRLLRHAAIVGVATLAVLAMTAVVGPAAPSAAIAVPANQLFSRTGTISGTARVARAGIDHPDVVAFGPYVPLAPGSYRVTIAYRSDAAQSSGRWEIANGALLLGSGSVPGSKGHNAAVQCSLHLRRDEYRVEVRVIFNGTANLRVDGLRFDTKQDKTLPPC